MGLFNINLRKDIKIIDDFNNKAIKNKSYNKKQKSNKSLNNTKSINIINNPNDKFLEKNQIQNISKSKLVKQNNMYNPILNNINIIKIKPISFLNNDELSYKHKKEIKKNNIIINEVYKIVKNNKKKKKYNHISENVKNELENTKNINKIIKNINEQLTNILKYENANNIYQYLILKGNASYLVKYCMYHRINWVEAENLDPNNPDYPSNIFNFKWK